MTRSRNRKTGGNRLAKPFRRKGQAGNGTPFEYESLEIRAMLSVSLVADINSLLPGSNPESLIDLNGTLLFTADDGVNGTELWKSDGTVAGTTIVKNINPTGDSNPGNFTVVDGELFFTAADGTGDIELWKSDATEAGTVRVSDIWVGGSSLPNHLTDVNGTLFFVADGGTDGIELWMSDGTDAGTQLVKDIFSGSGDSTPSELIDVAGTLYFQATDGIDGVELWKSDGTLAGTVQVKDILPGPGSSSPGSLTNVDGTLFFSADDGVDGVELWKSDGTEIGTEQVKDIFGGLSGSSPVELTNWNGSLMFVAESGSIGNELWKSDGTAAGTVLVRDIWSGSNSSSPQNFIDFGGTLLFSAENGSTGVELWKSDGTTAGTVLVKDINPGAADSNPGTPGLYSNMAIANGSLYFSADDGASGVELWKSDGTAVGTMLVKDINGGASDSNPGPLMGLNGTLMFGADEGNLGAELWQLDDRFESNDSLVEAADIGVGPGQHVNDLMMRANDDWFEFELLSPDNIDVKLAFSHADGNIDLEVFDSGGVPLGSSSSGSDNESVTLAGLNAGTYFVRAFGTGPGPFLSTYELAITPGVGSLTRVLYVNDISVMGDTYTTALGDDLNDGLSAAAPKASVQSLLNDHDIGPNDLILIDAGLYTSTAVITSVDEGASYAGSPGGTEMGGSGTRFELNDADSNLFYDFTFTTSGTGIYAHDDGVNESTSNVIRGNTFISNSTAVYISNGDSDVIEDNLIYGPGSYGIRYTSGTTDDGTTTFSGNTISDRTTGIYLSAPQSTAPVVVSQNTLLANTTGLLATRSSYFDLNLVISNNLVHGNTTGLVLRANGIQTFSNDIYNNTTGIRGDGGYGYGQIGWTDWNSVAPNLIHNNSIGIWTSYTTGVIQFNKIFSNATGIQSDRGTDINHNLIYRNTVRAILASNADNISIVNNTIYAPAGEGVRIDSFTSNALLRNNIIWTAAGYGIYVATDSQVGFDSDYNNLFSTGSGKLVWWQKEFADLFDWQVEADLDNNSIGYTSVHTTLDNPQFVNLGADDYHLTAEVSTSIDAGDPSSLYVNEPGPAGSAINLGAYGNTDEAAVSRTAYIEVDSPNFYTDLEDGIGQTVAWHTFDQSQPGKILAGDVDIDLYEIGFGKVADIAIAPASLGLVGWTPSSFGITGDIVKRYEIRITSVATPAIFDVSRESFSIVPDGNSFYVDDSSNTGDQYTPGAIGSNRNTGQDPTDPKANLLPILRSYDLGPADTVYIDNGDYVHVRNVVISGATGIGNDEGATFTGPTLAGSEAVIDRANTYSGSTNIELNDGDFVTLQYLTMTGAYRGLWVHNGSTNFSGDHLTVSNNVTDGMTVESDAALSVISSITAFNNGSTGISIHTSISNLSNSVAYNNSTGIYVSNSGGTPTVIGAVDALGDPDIASNTNPLSENRGNLVYNNSQYGIQAYYNVVVHGNNVYGNSNGIYVHSAEASRNAVHSNSVTGIYTYAASAVDNRVFNNTTGIYLTNNSSAQGNQVYSNTTGIIGGYYGPTIENNVVYSNIDYGVFLPGLNGGVVSNNTVYQASGVALRVESGSRNVSLNNNIFWSESGTAISVSANSQPGFDSDYNVLLAPGGATGSWQEVAQSGLTEWQSVTQQDAHSLTQDPLFVDADPLTNNLGFVDFTDYGQDDDFHLKSSYGSYHDGTNAPVYSAGDTAQTGLPVSATETLTFDGGFDPGVDRSSAIDRGDLLTSVGSEPATNGNFVNIGAYGGTEFASHSPSQYALVTSPDGGEVWPAEQSFDIQWRSHDALGTVNIDLKRVGDPLFSLPIAVSIANPGAGTYSWAVPISVTPQTDYRIQVTRNDVGVDDQSNFPFEITPPVNIYYVDDGSDANDQYTPGAIGSPSNTGLSAASPRDSIQSILADYTLGPNDVILVDTGVYNLTTNIVVGNNSVLAGQDEGGDATGQLLIQGPTDSDKSAVLDRGNTSTGSYVFELINSDYLTLDALSITGGQVGVYANGSSDSDGVVISNSEIYDNTSYGVEIAIGNDDMQVVSNVFHGGYYGVWVWGARALVSTNEVYDSNYGIYAYGSSLGAANAIQVVGNTVFSSTTGIYAQYDVTVEQNETYDNTTGINIQLGALAIDNTAHGNTNYGIYAYTGTAEDNRVFNNETGIYLAWYSTARGNQVYSNSTGILGGYRSPVIENNVVYANTNYGVLLSGLSSYGGEVTNNTIYQEVGDAVRVEGSSQNVALLNNVLWTEDGHAISVADNSQVGFASDYNVFQFPVSVPGTGLGQWAGLDFDNQADWFYELGFDGNSQVVDPQFVDFDGVDDLLGYQETTMGAAQILDDEDPGVTLVGSSWVETTTAGHAGDFWTSVDPTDTVSWQFAGLAAGTYQVAATWQYGNYSTAAEYTISQGGASQVLLQQDAYQRYNSPNDFSDAGVGWENLGTVVVTDTTLTVTLVNHDLSRGLFADAIRLQQIDGDAGGDDDFHVSIGSAAVDAGSLGSFYLAEPGGGGGRVNVGAYGNTSEAASSPSEYVQVLSPNGLEKYEEGQSVDVEWRSWGLGLTDTVSLLNAGSGGVVESWSAEQYRTTGSATSFANSVDTSGVTNAAPESVYQSYSYSNYGVGNSLEYLLPLSDGSYTVRLHFADPTYGDSPGTQVFDIVANGGLVVDDFDIATLAGADYRAATTSFGVTASGGNGLLLQLVNETYYRAILSGIEITQAAGGVASPTVDLDLSTNSGGSYTSIATGQPMDSRGRGSFSWTAGPQTTGNTALIRATANAGSLIDTSDNGFLITNAGNQYYVNDASLTNDQYSLAVGDNSASGKTVGDPMASLFALFAAYDLDAGDIVYVDTGNYGLIRNVVIGGDDSGDVMDQLVVQGPTDSDKSAVLDRGNTSTGSYVFELINSDYLTLDALSITGAQVGVYANGSSDSDGVVISNSEIYDNTSYGTYIDGGNDDLQVVSNVFHGGSYGVYAAGARALVSTNEVYDSNYGIYAYGSSLGAANAIQVVGNTVFSSTTGIYAQYDVTVEQNETYDNATGIYVFGGALAIDNTAHGNTNYGIYAYTGTAEDNRVFNNETGIYLAWYSTARGNQVYSNSTGILGGYRSPVIENNVVYANTNYGVLLSGLSSYGGEVTNNTIYQEVGDAVRVESNSQNVKLLNNILWVEAGRGIFVEVSSQNGFFSDYNLFFTGPDPTAKAGFWNGAETDTLVEWQAESGQDATSNDADPLFVDPDGADGTLGYSSAGSGFDAGLDDNFALSAGSPAIDSGQVWNAPDTDFFGQSRVDDPGTPNQGNDYLETDTGSSAFSATGTGQGWASSNGVWSYNFAGGFTFDFYGQTYSQVYVSSAGFLQFGNVSYDQSNTTAEFIDNRRIAPMWDDVRTNGVGDDIFVDTSVGGQVTFRWDATNNVDGSDLNFSATLFADGSIRFDYGSGNTNLTPTVGISAGDGQNFVLSTYDNDPILTNANSLAFSISAVGFVDIGAIEFTGSSLDVTPPTVVATNPIYVDAGSGGPTMDQIEITFSEALNAIDARATSNYELRDAGLNGILGDLDDNSYALVPDYTSGSQLVTLDIASGNVPLGIYRLTIFGGSGSGVHDLAGLTLDGDNNGTEGGNYVRDFQVNPEIMLVSPAGPIVEGDSGSTNATFEIKLSAAFSEIVTVDYATTNLGYANPATSGVDYVHTSGVATFLPGETSYFVDVPVNGDKFLEAAEEFGLELSNESANSVIADFVADTSIPNDDLFGDGIIVDFGTPTSPVLGIGVGFRTEDYSAAIGMGWSSYVSLSSAEKTVGNDLARDIAQMRSGTFSVDVPNDTYDIRIYYGVVRRRDPFRLTFESDPQVTEFLTFGTNVSRVYQTTVSDGQLNMAFAGAPGLDPFFRISGFRIDPVVSKGGPADGSPNEKGSGIESKSDLQLWNPRTVESFVTKSFVTNREATFETQFIAQEIKSDTRWGLKGDAYQRNSDPYFERYAMDSSNSVDDKFEMLDSELEELLF